MPCWKTDPARRIITQAGYHRSVATKNCFFHPIPDRDSRVRATHMASEGRGRINLSFSLRELPANELPFHISIIQ